MPGAKIEVWLDCNSYYSRFALQHLRRFAAELASNGVEYDVHPVFINGINVGSGNKPPWMLPAKAKYGQFDGDRARKYFGYDKPMIAPKEFPLKTVLALRSMCYIKDTYPKERFEVAFLELWTAIWEQQMNIGNVEEFTTVLKRHFDDKAVTSILEAAQSAKYKEKLSANVDIALKRGAFGAPWFWVRNAKGAEEPFFGSDRFHYMWDYLDIPHQDFQVLAKAGAKL